MPPKTNRIYGFLPDTENQIVDKVIHNYVDLDEDTLTCRVKFEGKVRYDDKPLLTDQIFSKEETYKRSAVVGAQMYWYETTQVWGVKVYITGAYDIEPCFHTEEEARAFKDKVVKWILYK